MRLIQQLLLSPATVQPSLEIGQGWAYNRKEAVLPPHSRQSLSVKGFVMASKFAIGDKVDHAFSNHAEGTVVAIFRDLAGEHRYAIEMFGHRTIQIASEGNLSAHGNHAP